MSILRFDWKTCQRPFPHCPGSILHSFLTQRRQLLLQQVQTSPLSTNGEIQRAPRDQV